MVKTIFTGLSEPCDSSSRNELENKTDELAQLYTPFDSNRFDFESSEKKYETYLLNMEHTIGGSKAKFLKETLGYSSNDAQLLHQNLKKALQDKIPNYIEKTEYGIKAEFKIKLEGNNGKYEYANITVVLQKDKGETNWRIITITPNKKDKGD